MANTRVITPEARLSFPALFRPAKPMNEGQQAKYQCELIFDADTDLEPLRAAANQAAKDKWGDKIPKNIRSPFRDGGDRDGIDGYAGKKFITARSIDKPGVVVGPNKEPCLDESEVYGGCYVRVSVTAFAYEVTGNKGVSFALNNVWKVRDGEPFVNRISAEDDFADCDGSAYGSDETTSSLL